jgi:hypothetical protein
MSSSRNKQYEIPHAYEVLKQKQVSQVLPLASLLQASPQATQTLESRQLRQLQQIVLQQIRQLPQKIVKFLTKYPRLDLLFPSLYTQTMKKLSLSFDPAFMEQIAKNISYMNLVRDLIKERKNFSKSNLSLLSKTKNIKMTSNPKKMMVLYEYYESLEELIDFLFMTPAQRQLRYRPYQQQLSQQGQPVICDFFKDDLMFFLKNNPINYNNPKIGKFNIENKQGQIEYQKYGIRCTLNRLMTVDEISQSKFFRPFHTESESNNLTNPQFFMYFYTPEQVKLFEDLYKKYCDQCVIRLPSSFFVEEYGSKSRNIVLLLE